MVGACGTHGEEDKYVQNSSEEILKKETTWET